MQHTFLKNPWLWRCLLVGYVLILLVLTHVPLEPSPSPARGLDKLAHGAAFAVLAMILAATWRASAGRLSLAQLASVWAAIAAYAALDEWTQSFVGRTPSAWDWLADGTGAAIGLAVFVWFFRSAR
jgi:VanZ family protein